VITKKERYSFTSNSYDVWNYTYNVDGKTKPTLSKTVQTKTWWTFLGWYRSAAAAANAKNIFDKDGKTISKTNQVWAAGSTKKKYMVELPPGDTSFQNTNTRKVYAAYGVTIEKKVVETGNLIFHGNGGVFGEDEETFAWNGIPGNSKVTATTATNFTGNTPTTRTYRALIAGVSDVSKSVQIPVRPGYKFLGYAATPAPSSANYPNNNANAGAWPSAGVTIPKNGGTKIVYARWQKIQPTIEIEGEDYSDDEIADLEEEIEEQEEEEGSEEIEEEEGETVDGGEENDEDYVAPTDGSITEEDGGTIDVDDPGGDDAEDDEEDSDDEYVPPDKSVKTPKYDTDLSTPGNEGFVYRTNQFVYMWVDIKTDCAVMPFYSTQAINALEDGQSPAGAIDTGGIAAATSPTYPVPTTAIFMRLYASLI
jgi:hypothetical protein